MDKQKYTVKLTVDLSIDIVASNPEDAARLAEFEFEYDWDVRGERYCSNFTEFNLIASAGKVVL